MSETASFRQIGIVGTGRLARALARGLAPASPAAPLFLGRSQESCAAAIASAGTGVPAADIVSLARRCDLVAIAVSDGAIVEIVDRLAECGPLDRGMLVFHASGASGAAVLDPLREGGAAVAAIHPAMTFTGDPAREVERMRQARFAVTAPDHAMLERARSVVAALGGVAVAVSETHRPLYHAALCHASNHLVTLVDGAMALLEAAGVDAPAALLGPLVHAALENSLEKGLGALSGPILRNDGASVAGHIDALAGACPELLPAYRAMALATLDALAGRGAPPDRSALRARLAPEADTD